MEIISVLSSLIIIGQTIIYFIYWLYIKCTLDNNLNYYQVSYQDFGTLQQEQVHVEKKLYLTIKNDIDGVVEFSASILNNKNEVIYHRMPVSIPARGMSISLDFREFEYKNKEAGLIVLILKYNNISSKKTIHNKRE